MTAVDFRKALAENIEEKEKEKLKRFYKGEDPQTKALGVRFGTVFSLANQFRKMDPEHIEALLEDNHYEIRMGAVSIMDYQVRIKSLAPERKGDLYRLYLRRHDRIDNWDLVDRAAPHVVGGYLWDKDRSPLYDLASSSNQWERRTAIVSTLFFIRKGDLEEAFALAALLIDDEHELVNKAVGTYLREAGKRDEDRLRCFLDSHAATMPRVTLRYSLEKLDPASKEYYRALRKK